MYFTGFDIFEVFELKTDCQSGWRPNEGMKMSGAPSFGAPGSLIFVVVAQLLKQIILYQPKLGLAYPQNGHLTVLFFLN